MTIALITAAAGIGGGLTTALVSSLIVGRHDQQKWARDLREKDRDRLQILFDEIVSTQVRVLTSAGALLRGHGSLDDLQVAVRDSMNDYALLAYRAEVLGAVGLSAGSFSGAVQQARRRAMEGEAFDDDALREFEEECNREASQLRKRMAENLKRLRTDL